ncbi:MAG: hypothetical protein KIH63_002980 [Candidatus Saccharibacteria bacterium]|nr:hypothetical protein [Candidatus Saccharibacteria bacterium]
METWRLENIEQNVLDVTHEAMGFMVGFATFGAANVDAGRHSVGATIDFAPVMEDEEEGSEYVRPEPLLWPMPQYPKSLGSIALGPDGIVYAEDRQFALAA